jgi:hypothetical protein
MLRVSLQADLYMTWEDQIFVVDVVVTNLLEPLHQHPPWFPLNLVLQIHYKSKSMDQLSLCTWWVSSSISIELHWRDKIACTTIFETMTVYTWIPNLFTKHTLWGM